MDPVPKRPLLTSGHRPLKEKDGKMTRRTILTEEVLATIPPMTRQGMSVSEIAEKLGVKVPTLKVRCSQARISLRRPHQVKPIRQLMLDSVLQLSRETVLKLREWAEPHDITEAQLATLLLEVIARDNLIEAILDRQQPKAA
jgi:hypothetical protein